MREDARRAPSDARVRLSPEMICTRERQVQLDLLGERDSARGHGRNLRHCAEELELRHLRKMGQSGSTGIARLRA